MRQKIFQRKSRYPLPIHKSFRKENFSEKGRVLTRTFSVLWGNQVSTKSWYTILCNFLNPKLFSIKRVTLGFFWDCQTKKFRSKIVISLLSINFFYKKNFWKTKGSPTNFFGTARQKKFERNSWYPLPIHKPFR